MPVPPPFFGTPLNVIVSNPRQVGLLIENRLTAFTVPGSLGSEAFIEKKFAGVQMTVTPVPVPPALALFAAGALMLAPVMRRRRRAASPD